MSGWDTGLDLAGGRHMHMVVVWSRSLGLCRLPFISRADGDQLSVQLLGARKKLIE